MICTGQKIALPVPLPGTFESLAELLPPHDVSWASSAACCLQAFRIRGLIFSANGLSLIQKRVITRALGGLIDGLLRVITRSGKCSPQTFFFKALMLDVCAR